MNIFTKSGIAAIAITLALPIVGANAEQGNDDFQASQAISGVTRSFVQDRAPAAPVDQVVLENLNVAH